MILIKKMIKKIVRLIIICFSMGGLFSCDVSSPEIHTSVCFRCGKCLCIPCTEAVPHFLWCIKYVKGCSCTPETYDFTKEEEEPLLPI